MEQETVYTENTLKPITDYIDSFYNEGVPYQIKIDLVTFLLLLILVIAPVVTYYAFKAYSKK